MKKLIYISILCIGALLFAGCNNETTEQKQEQAEKKQIVATLFPQYDFARQIAGDKMDVSLLLPTGVESHAFEPTPKDIIHIHHASLLIYTGENMEAWVPKLLTDINPEKTKVLDISANLPLMESDHNHEHEGETAEEHAAHATEEEHDHEGETAEEHAAHATEGEHDHEGETAEEHAAHATEEEHDHDTTMDPHVWTSLSNAQIIMQDILNAMIEIDPENQDYYTANAESYLKQLNAVDQEIQQIIAHAKRKKIIFAGHFALSYFAEQYGIEYVAAYPSTSTDAEPSVKDIAAIIDQITNEEIPVIYYEELVDPKVAKSIHEQTGAEMLLLHSLHNVSKDEFEQGVTYVSLMEQNAKNLKKGLN